MKLRHILVLTLAVSGIAACGTVSNSADTGADSEPSSYPRREFCERFKNFVSNDLGVLDAKFDDPSEPGRQIEWNTTCQVTRTPDSRGIGILSIHNPRMDGTVEPTLSSYQPHEGFGEKVWMTNDDQFRTQVGPWIAELSFRKSNIRTSNGDLTFGNEEIRKTVEFLIQVTRAVQE